MAVLVTGATGSLGGWLCAELLRSTQATVRCLVRAGSQEDADQRLAARMQIFSPPSGRLIALLADIRRPDLGLRPAERDRLAEDSDRIIHCAAHVNLAADYDQLVHTNVGGTQNMIDFAQRRVALTGEPADLHYISTTAVFLNHHAAGLSHADESSVPTLATAGSLGYPRSKVLAETMLRQAADRGIIRLTIHRPGLVTADHATGRTSATSDLLVPVLRACVALGAIPTSAAEASGVDCIDSVARGIIHLALVADSVDRVFHHIQPAPFKIMDALQALSRAGYRLKPTPNDQWWGQVQGNLDNPAVRPIGIMSEIARYLLYADVDHPPPSYRADFTTAALTAVGIARPSLDAPFLDRLIKGLQEARVLPSLARHAASARTHGATG
ncbi:SDR family oxidoreductase [Umezawaea endophytica]|uniref:SDR family oxidoreductase n=1 Tax=Umezawaea endophytica TaxID=1654476 RepID=A0A9X2VLA0_9PSEU|nr:SDR family oxidoreductase [Umezawaea endophytica]MCS7478758.1 SDR family oxidoreductase [Umezawaea endophytica]